MPLCTPADVKGAIGARIDADITEFDAQIPLLIRLATAEIEQYCNLPRGWFDQTPAPDGIDEARMCCIALCTLHINSPDQVEQRRVILMSSILDSVRNYGPTPELPVPGIPLWRWDDGRYWRDADVWTE